VVPALILNLLWASRLPSGWQFNVFWKNIPSLVAYGEKIARLVVNVLPLFMPLQFSTVRQKQGLMIYIVGITAYIAAWVMMVYFPQSAWSTSLIGSTATAWTSLVWLVGIGLIGESLIIPISYSYWVYILSSVIFSVFHTIHAVIIYLRIP
jgi:hypothetical protein